MTALTELRCVACRPDSPPVTPEQIAALLPQIPGWTIVERDGIPRLERVFRFRRYADAVRFTNAVAALAEEEGHHPTLLLEARSVTVSWWTHAIRNLHLNDFIAAAKTDRCFERLASG
ncbi:MAG: 4a-hydroxytetrahydrobiopterin dehydratase [Chloroflexota bacterium]|nr:4a-hydroxytetrahydrobiopterin dehydratase [Dehalococcoidia bacterium]MDW8252407.1 4a-hydroxytetrahydrobiopterin dehydratase [Chloroflexota bacterium]